MPDQHCRLSPSAAYRWMRCTASPEFTKDLPNPPSEYAKEGTLAHSLAEKKLKYFFDGTPIVKDQEYPDEMEVYTNEYRDYIADLYFDACQKVDEDEISIWIEKRLDLTDWIERGFGTADFILWAGPDLHVVDFKYGQGVKVFAEENEQLKIYGLGALFLTDSEEVERIHLHIVQPRIGHIDKATYRKRELYNWGWTELTFKAVEASSGKGEFVAGSHCRFCPAAGNCPERNRQMKEQIEKARQGDMELAEILGHCKEWSEWISQIQETSLNRVLEGEEIPGYKAVAGRGKRVISDAEQVAKILEEQGYKPYKEPEILPLTKLEKLTGKKKFNELCHEYIEQVEGKPVLVPESDPRPALMSAESVFEVIEGD